MRFLVIAILALFVSACASSPPRAVEKEKIVAVMVDESAFELKDVTKPMPREEYFQLSEEEMVIEDTTLIQKLYGDIKILRAQVRGIYKAMIINKETLESENK